MLENTYFTIVGFIPTSLNRMWIKDQPSNECSHPFQKCFKHNIGTNDWLVLVSNKWLKKFSPVFPSSCQCSVTCAREHTVIPVRHGLPPDSSDQKERSNGQSDLIPDRNIYHENGPILLMPRHHLSSLLVSLGARGAGLWCLIYSWPGIRCPAVLDHLLNPIKYIAISDGACRL